MIYTLLILKGNKTLQIVGFYFINFENLVAEF
jgi:hypothetical protein